MKNDVTKIIGYILLTPGLVSVLTFVCGIFSGENLLNEVLKVSDILYFGLMAIAGAYLIKDNK